MAPSENAATPAQPGGGIWLALSVVYLAWGSIFIGIKLTIAGLPPLGSMAVRFIVAGVLMLGWVAWRRGRAALAIDRVRGVNVAVLGVLLLGFGNGGNAIGQLLGVPSGTTALIVATVPMFVLVFGILEGHRPSAWSLGALGLGLTGMAILVTGGSGSAGLPVAGLVAVLLGCFTWALGSWLQPRLTVPGDALANAAYQMVAAGIFLLFCAVVRGEQLPARVDGRSLLALLYLIVVGSIIGFTCYSWLLGRAPLRLIATHTFVNPVVAVTLGALLAGEALTGRVLIGGLIIVVAVVLAITDHVRGPTPRPPSAS